MQKPQKRSLVIAIIALLVGGMMLVIPTLTQDDDTCDIDLGEVAMLLIQAQDAAGAGDTTTALNILADAEAQIGALRDACGGALGRFTTYTTSDDAYRFNYPSGWVFDVENRNTFILGTSEEALERFFEVDPSFPAGLQAVGVLIGEARQVGGERGDDLSGIMDAYEANLGELAYEVSGRESIGIDGQPGERLDFSGEGFESALIGLELPAEDTFAIVIASAAPGEFDTLEPIALDIAASIEAAPEPPPAPISLEQTFTYEDGQMAFDYPAGWVLSEEDNFGDGATIILANSNSALTLLESQDLPAFSPGQQLIFVGVGAADTIGNVDDDVASVDAIVAQVAESLIPEISMSDIVMLDYDGRPAAEFTLDLLVLNTTIHVIELRPRETFAILLMLGASEDTEQNQRLIRAVAESIRFPPSADPLGEPSVVQTEMAETSEATPEPDDVMPTAAPEIRVTEAVEEPEVVVEEVMPLGAMQSVGAFTFAYPEEWIVGDSMGESGDSMTTTFLGTSAGAIEALNQSDPTLQVGEQAIGIFTGAPNNLFSIGVDSATPQAVLEEIMADNQDDDFDFDDIETVTINGFDAAQVIFSDTGFSGAIIAIAYTPDVYALIIAGGAPGEGEVLYAVARSIAESVMFDPDAVSENADVDEGATEAEEAQPRPTATPTS